MTRSKSQRIDDLDARILEILQWSFPLSARPFREVGRSLGIREDEVLRRLRNLKASKVLREIRVIFVTRMLGLSSSLVAFRVPRHRLDAASEVVNDHPGVSHNYARSGHYNLWFTIAVPEECSLDSHIAKLCELASPSEYLNLPSLREFKIGLRLNLALLKTSAVGHSRLPRSDRKGALLVIARSPDAASGRRSNPMFSTEQLNLRNDASNEAPSKRENLRKAPRRELERLLPLTSRDREVVKVLHGELLIAPRPFDPPARKISLHADDLLALIETFILQGRIRRVAAILNHREAGFKSNAMGVWRVRGSSSVENAGRLLAESPAVSHCYLRPSHPSWPYNLYAMIHGRSPLDCRRLFNDFTSRIPDSNRGSQLLWTRKEYKKESLHYLTEPFKAWEGKHSISRESKA